MEEILLNQYASQTKKCQAFYDFCSKENQTIPIKKLFLKLHLQTNFNSEILSAGLMASLENGHEKYVSIIVQYMEKHSITADIYDLSEASLMLIEQKKDCTQILEFLYKHGLADKKYEERLQGMFNCATSNHNSVVADYLNDKYSVLENAISNDMGNGISLLCGAHSVFADFQSDGSLSVGGAMGGPLSEKEEKINHYVKNPILFNLKNFNSDVLDKFFDNDYKIHPSLMLHAIVENVYLNNEKAISYLFENEKCTDVIKNCNDIRNFIESDENYSENKTQVRNYLLKNALEESIPHKGEEHNNSKNKL